MKHDTTPDDLEQRRYPVLILQNDPVQWRTIHLAMEHCFPELEAKLMTHIITASTYLDTVSAISQAVPRLIFIDFSLPNQKDGLAFLIQLKADSRFKKIPVIILSDSHAPEDISLAYFLGADSCLLKPLNYIDWLSCFSALKSTWWELAKLPDYR